MAEATGKTRCIKCGKEKATMRCGGCLQEYCYNHMGNHRQELNKQLDEIEVNRDLFRESFTQHIEQPNNHFLIQQINQWEQNSIKVIQQTAEEAIQVLLKNTSDNIHQTEQKLNELTNQLRESRQENDFNEINLRDFQKELDKLRDELTRPSNISIQEDRTSLINKISVHVSSKCVTLILINVNTKLFTVLGSTSQPNIDQNTKWIQKGVTVAGGNGEGNGLNQLNSPCSVYVDDDRTVYVVDSANHRIVEWKYGATIGEVVAGGNGKGNRMNQLDCPRDVIINKERNNLMICDRDNRRIVCWSRQNRSSAEIFISNIDCCRLKMDKNNYLYISDYKKHEVRRWTTNETSGTLVAGGNGTGNQCNQLNEPTFIFVDDDRSVYVSDHKNNRVMKWMDGAKEGVVVAGGQGQGNGLTQLSGPGGILVDHFGTVYVADCYNNRIMCWYKGAKQANIVVDGNGKGEQANQLNRPGGLSFDRQGNLYVVDFGNNRVQRFDIDQS